MELLDLINELVKNTGVEVVEVVEVVHSYTTKVHLLELQQMFSQVGHEQQVLQQHELQVLLDNHDLDELEHEQLEVTV